MLNIQFFPACRSQAEGEPELAQEPGRVRVLPRACCPRAQGHTEAAACLQAPSWPRDQHTLPTCCPPHGAQERRGGSDRAPLVQSQPRQVVAGFPPSIRSTRFWEHPAPPQPPPALTEMASLVHVSMMGCSRLSNSFMSNWVSSRSFCICCSTAWATAAVTCSWEAEQDGDYMRKDLGPGQAWPISALPPAPGGHTQSLRQASGTVTVMAVTTAGRG